MNEVLELYTDTANGVLYVCGNMVDDFQTPEQAAHYCTYEDDTWTVSAPFDNMVFTSVVLHDTLYVGGWFNSIDGAQISFLAKQVNGVWSSDGAFDNTVWRLKILNGELYAVGGFEHVDGQLCQGIAKRSGGTWQPVVPVGCDYCSVRDIALYHDELYICGTILFPTNAYRHVLRLQNGSWVPVGEVGLHGGISAGNTLEVYGDDLYFGGLFQLSDGNAGDAIMRWDGNAWTSVGTGVQDETGGYGQWIQITDLLSYDGLLYVAGGLTYAGNVPANRIATWNGSEWCSIGGNFGEYYVTALGFYNDTLYAGCWYEADGQPVNHLAKFIAPAYEGSCSVPMAVPAETHGMELRPHGEDSYALSGHERRSGAVLYDALGRQLARFYVDGASPFTLPKGTGLRILEVDGVRRFKLL